VKPCAVDYKFEELMSNLLNPIWPIKDILDEFFKVKEDGWMLGWDVIATPREW